MEHPERFPTDLPPRSAETDWLAIVRLTHDYCWAIDAGDWSALHEVFAADVEADLGEGGQRGVDEVIARVASVLGPLDASHHTVSTHQITVDGERATGRCAVLAQHVRRRAEGGATFLVGGRYEDEYRCTAVGWRIVRRRIVVTWTEGNPRVLGPDSG